MNINHHIDMDLVKKLRFENRETLQSIGKALGVSKQRIQQLLGNTGFMKIKKSNKIRKTFVEKVYSRIDKETKIPCWIWTGYCDYLGYPALTCGKKGYLIHRLIYAIENKMELRQLKYMRRICSNIKCVNPNHYKVSWR